MERIEVEPTLLQREHDCVEHGNLRDGQGMYDKAIAAYDIALGIDPMMQMHFSIKGLP